MISQEQGGSMPKEIKIISQEIKPTAFPHFGLWTQPEMEKVPFYGNPTTHSKNIRIMKEHIIILSNLTHSRYCLCFVSLKRYPPAGIFWYVGIRSQDIRAKSDLRFNLLSLQMTTRRRISINVCSVKEGHNTKMVFKDNISNSQDS